MKFLTEEELYLYYPCIINHIERLKQPISVNDEDICGFGGKCYETYGEELDYVMKMANQDRVLTIIEGDEDEIDNDGEPTSIWYITSGFHYVNRIGYLVTEQPLNGDQFEVKLEF
jgi:hypothetical protein